MASPTVNVLRWSVFGTGIAYGFLHNRTLASTAAEKHSAAEFARKENLIAQAKAKYAELHKKPATGGVVTDIEDPNFDVEKYIEHAISE